MQVFFLPSPGLFIMAMTGYSMTSGKTNMSAPLGYGNGLEFAARTVIYVTMPYQMEMLMVRKLKLLQGQG